MALPSLKLKGLPTLGNNSLSSSQDYYNLAIKSGLQDEADRLLAAQSGEQTKKIFSGGFISDIFDVLNSLQYGVVGMLKGKGFKEGVLTRQSFSDKDALGDNGLPGTIAGILLDIAVDPLTYIAPATILKKIPGFTKTTKAAKAAVFGKKVEKTIETAQGIKKFQQLEGGTKAGKWVANKLVYMFGADPVFKEGYERAVKNIAVGTTNVADITKGVANLTPEMASKILKRDETGRFLRTSLDDLKNVLSPDEFNIVKKAYDTQDFWSREAAKYGLVGKEKVEANIGEYIKNAYKEYEKSKGIKGLFGKAKIGIKKTYAKARKAGLTQEQMAKLGQIENPAYLLFKGTIDLVKDVENAKLFSLVNKSFASDVLQEGFKQLPKTARLGELAGKYVPESMFDYIQEISEPIKYTMGKKLVADFKFMKVVMNPATHARNVVSNSILNWWKLGIGPWRADLYGEALKQTVKGGKWIDEAKTVGYGIDTFASNELIGLLDDKSVAGFGKTLGGTWGKVKKSLGNIYQSEESLAKLAAFIAKRKTGVGIEDAWKVAESATFNYAQVTPFIRKLRTALFGFPFITFTTKATPIAVETALKAPRRISVFGKIKQGIENMSDIQKTDKERASEPPWIKDGFYIKLPIKDSQGRSAYFDLTYIIPFGDIVSGQLLQRQVERETGTKETLPEAVASTSPAFNFLKEISRNQDFYGNRIWNESDDSTNQLKDLFRHFSKTFLPPLVSDQIPGGYNNKGERVQRGFIGTLTPSEEQNQKRTLTQELLRQVGVKIQPIDADIQKTYQEWNRKKALKTLLRENNILGEFPIDYVK